MTDRTQAPNRELRSLNAEEVESTLAEWGHKSYRVTQILPQPYCRSTEGLSIFSGGQYPGD